MCRTLRILAIQSSTEKSIFFDIVAEITKQIWKFECLPFIFIYFFFFRNNVNLVLWDLGGVIYFYLSKFYVYEKF